MTIRRTLYALDTSRTRRIWSKTGALVQASGVVSAGPVGLVRRDSFQTVSDVDRTAVAREWLAASLCLTMLGLGPCGSLVSSRRAIEEEEEVVWDGQSPHRRALIAKQR